MTSILFQTTLFRKKKWHILIGLSIWISLWLIALGTMFHALISTSFRSDVFGLIFLLLVMGFIPIKIFLRNCIDCEIITIYQDRIELLYKSKINSRSITIPLLELIEVGIDRDNTVPLWFKYWGINRGIIFFQGLGNKNRIGRDISFENAEETVSEINRALELN